MNTVKKKRMVLAAVSQTASVTALEFAEGYLKDPAIGDDALGAYYDIYRGLKEPDRRAWKVAASHKNGSASGAIDGKPDSRWDTATPMKPGMWFTVDLGSPQTVGAIVLDASGSNGDYARGYEVYLSDDGKQWRKIYQHSGETFNGFTDKKPLVVDVAKEKGRYLRIQLPTANYLHLDEVEVFGPDDPAKNLALKQPASQSSPSEWSTTKPVSLKPEEIKITATRLGEILQQCQRVIEERDAEGVDVASEKKIIERLKKYQATMCSAPASIRPGTLKCGRHTWAKVRCYRRSSNWWKRRKGRKPRCNDWQTRSRGFSYLS